MQASSLQSTRGSSPSDQYPSNRQLLERYVAHRDESAFAELVRRTGPMVLGVARRLLHDYEDADDAAQLAFAELARRAGTIESPDGLASWLHIVTVHIALRLRRRRPSHGPLIDDPVDPRLSLDQVAQRSDFEILSEELERLPDSWREPLVLRYLGGLSNEDAAAQLGTSVAALEGRLKRGKKSLRVRLLRRGVSVASVFAALAPARFIDAAQSQPFDADQWASVTDAAQELASEPSALTFLPATETTMVTPLLTAKAIAATGAAAVALTMFGGHGDGPVLEQGSMPIATVVAAGDDSGDVSISASIAQATDDPVGGSGVEELTGNAKPASGFGEAGPFGGVDPFAESSDTTPEGFQGSPVSAGSQSDSARTPSLEAVGTTLVAEPRSSREPVTDDLFSGRSAGAVSNVDVAAQADAEPDDDVGQRSRQTGQRSVRSIQSMLESTSIDLAYVDTPLGDVVDDLSEVLNVPIVLDRSGLDRIGYGVDEPVTFRQRTASVRNALVEILTQRIGDLDYVIRDDHVLITLAEIASAMTSTRVYALPAQVESQLLIEAMTRHVSSSDRGSIEWDDRGGNGVATVLQLGLDWAPMLVVTQSDRGHEGVSEFLELLTGEARGAASPREPIRPRTNAPGPDVQAVPVQSQPAMSFVPETFDSQSPDVQASSKGSESRVELPSAYNADDFLPESFTPYTGQQGSADRGGAAAPPVAETESMEALPATELPKTLAAYEVAELSGLLYGYVATGDGYINLQDGYGSEGDEFDAGSGSVSQDSRRPRALLTIESLKKLVGSEMDFELSIQRGSQMIVRADRETHARLKAAMEELTEQLKTVGDPEISGSTIIDDVVTPSPGGGGFF